MSEYQLQALDVRDGSSGNNVGVNVRVESKEKKVIAAVSNVIDVQRISFVTEPWDISLSIADTLFNKVLNSFLAIWLILSTGTYFFQSVHEEAFGKWL